jgi:hypothetical protein
VEREGINGGGLKRVAQRHEWSFQHQVSNGETFLSFSVSLWLGEKGFSVTFDAQARHSLKFDFVFRNQWN